MSDILSAAEEKSVLDGSSVIPLDELQAREIESAVCYRFKDKNLLATAFTEKSYSNENGGDSNERLEFLGDKVLNFSVAHWLFCKLNNDEGDLTTMCANIISREPLAAATEKLDILKFYRRGVGAANELNLSDKFISNLFEAIIGAIYLDGGMECAEAFVLRHLVDGLDGKNFLEKVLVKNYKSRLQECLQRDGIKWTYDEEPDVNEGFKSYLRFSGYEFCGRGRKKKDAQQSAAKSACEKLKFE